MTDLEKEAIEILRELYSYQKGKAIPGADDYIFNKEYKATETVLNLIEKQQNRIKEREMTLVRYTAQTLNADIKQMHKHNEDLEMLYKGCQIELQKKDKIIDLMEEEINKILKDTFERLGLAAYLEKENITVREFIERKVNSNEQN